MTSTFSHDGCTLAYSVAGSGPPVLFIQGVGIHGDGWIPQTESLSSDFQCITFDNRGIGKSGAASGKLTVEQLANDALALLDHLEVESAHLVGHSLGGVIAQEIALSAPDRVRSLALLCTVSRGADATRLSGRMLWLGIASSIGTRRSRRRAFLKIVTAPGTVAPGTEDEIASSLQPLFGHDLGDRPAIAMKQLAALRAYDSTSRLRHLSAIRTLVISARHDLIARPEYARRLAAGIPGARYVEIEDAAHGVPIQLPGVVNGLLHDHLTDAEWATSQPSARVHT